MTVTRRASRAAGAKRERVSSGRNRVRIIGGDWRSRVLKFPESRDLRPTPDRVRETLFNWLGQRVDGLSCLDLFAGSGALGFEALSRGARSVVMVERDRAAAASLRENAAVLGAAAVEIVQGDALGYLDRAAQRFDIAFVDPPYGTGLLARALDALPRVLSEGARVYVEDDRPLGCGAPWSVLREDRAGAVRYALLELSRP